MFKLRPTNPELEKVTKFTVKKKASYLRSHFKSLENTFQEKSASLWQEIELEDKRTENHDDDSQYDYSASESLKEIEHIYLRMHRYSAILATYSYLESSMNKLCEEFKKKMKIKISVDDLNGDGIHRCKKYLTLLANVDFEKINPQWSHLATLNKLRNCIMHADGNAELVRDSEKFITQIKSNRDMYFVEQNMVMVSNDFVCQSIDNIEIVLIHIIGYGK